MTTQIIVPLSTTALKTYSPIQQHYGTFIAGYPWTLYCTGTFRTMVNVDSANRALDRYAIKLSRAMQYKPRQLSFYAALEDRWSGLHHSAVRRHWHFLLACPQNSLLASVAEQLWLENGFCKIEPYDPAQGGSYYINKLIAEGAEIRERNMQHLPYTGPTDLIEAARQSPYVPKRLAEKTSGVYLR